MAEFGDTADVKRVLDWFTTVPGNKGVAYPEFHALIPRPVPPLPPMGVIVWGWGEIVGLFISSVLGARPDTSGRNLLMRPTLPDGVNKVNGTVTHRGREIRITIERGKASATWNGRALTKDGDAWKLPDDVRGGEVIIRV
jgi:hypothetical protein